MCETWAKDFAVFLADMGPRPSRQHSLDRIDTNGPYSPENCRWATRTQQASNTRRNWHITHDGRTQNIAQWARELGLGWMTLAHRINRKWPIERALTSRKYNRLINPPG